MVEASMGKELVICLSCTHQNYLDKGVLRTGHHVTMSYVDEDEAHALKAWHTNQRHEGNASYHIIKQQNGTKDIAMRSRHQLTPEEMIHILDAIEEIVENAEDEPIEIQDEETIVYRFRPEKVAIPFQSQPDLVRQQVLFQGYIPRASIQPFLARRNI